MNPETVILIVRKHEIVTVLDQEVRRDVKFVESAVVETDRKETTDKMNR